MFSLQGDLCPQWQRVKVSEAQHHNNDSQQQQRPRPAAMVLSRFLAVNPVPRHPAVVADDTIIIHRAMAVKTFPVWVLHRSLLSEATL